MAAEAVGPGAVSNDRLGKLDVLDWKLEYVLGRLHGTMGDEALTVLAAMRVDIPNEGHMLAAALLAHGGIHVTLNFDEGIERAYELLSHTSGAMDVPPEFEVALAEWRRAVGPIPSPLRVVASCQELAAWVGDAESAVPPAALLVKLHGGVQTHGGFTTPYHPVVTDEVELAQLSADQRWALDELCRCDVLVVTGYSGEDIDCYEPLLHRIEERDGAPTVWADPGKMRPAVRAALSELEVICEPVDAVTILRRHGLAGLPPWPRTERTPAPWRSAFEAWSRGIDDLEAAEGYAWMLIDAGELAEAVGMLRRVLARQSPAHPRTVARLADALYDSGHDKRDEAMECYRRALSGVRPTGGLATYAWVRWGECHRPFPGVWNHVATVVGALVAPWDRAPEHVRARVLNSLAHTLARLAERTAPWVLRGGRGPFAGPSTTNTSTPATRSCTWAHC